MGFWGRIFGTDKAIETAADGIYNGVDMAFYTDEEKAIARQKQNELYIKVLKAYEPFKLAQRVLAFLYSIPYVSIVTYGIIMRDTALIDSANDALGLQTLVILAFYFAGGAGEGIIRAKIEGK